MRCCKDDVSVRLQGGPDINGRDSILITGDGTAASPFEVSFAGLKANVDTDDIHILLAWDTDHYQLSATFAPSSNLSSIGDVNAPTPADDDVLGWDATASEWTPRAPSTASAGTVLTGSSIDGDGSAGNALDVAFDPDGMIEDTGAGVSLTAEALAALTLRFATGTDRDTALLTPALNQLTMIDTAPGVIDYWDGSDWLPLLKLVEYVGTEYLALSGGFGGEPVTVLVVQLDTTTDASGVFEVLSAVDLTGRAGVLSVTVQPLLPTGGTPWTAMLTSPASGNVEAVAYALDGSGPLDTLAVSAAVTAHLY